MFKTENLKKCYFKWKSGEAFTLNHIVHQDWKNITLNRKSKEM